MRPNCRLWWSEDNRGVAGRRHPRVPGRFDLKLRAGLMVNAILLAVSAATGLDAPVRPLVCAHAHNDYQHPRPLLDALECGFCSVEADIHLVAGQLLVGHDSWNLKPERTLAKLYLDPLRERVRKNGGRVYVDGPEFSLLIDVKTDADQTYAALHEVLKRYADMLTQFTTNSTERKAILVVISGNRPGARVAAGPVRYAALDGRLSDLDADASKQLVPWISDNWSLHFKWRGTGPLPDEERQKLRMIVERAHQQGRRVRFWGAPDSPVGWGELRKAGVDLINTDKLPELQKFLLQTPTHDGGAYNAPPPGQRPIEVHSTVSVANTRELNILNLLGAFQGVGANK